jgi:hypothetical protein
MDLLGIMVKGMLMVDGNCCSPSVCAPFIIMIPFSEEQSPFRSNKMLLTSGYQALHKSILNSRNKIHK